MRQNWEECRDDFLTSIGRRSVATRTSYATMLRQFFSLHEDLGSVTRRDVEKFMQTHFPDPHRTQQGELAIATQNSRLAVLVSFYSFAASWIPESCTEPLYQGMLPTAGIIRGKPERSPKGLTLDEVRRLFAVIPTTTEIGIRDRAVLLFYLYSARRRAELAPLCYGDIQPAILHDRQGHSREGFRFFFRGKGQKSRRDSAELVPIVKDAIDWYLIASGRIETIQPGDPLFIAVGRETGHGGNVRPGEIRPLTDSAIAKRMAVYASLAGVEASLHTLRHTSAQMRIDAGEDIISIKELLRHRLLQTTYGYLRGLSATEDAGYGQFAVRIGEL